MKNKVDERDCAVLDNYRGSGISLAAAGGCLDVRYRKKP